MMTSRVRVRITGVTRFLLPPLRLSGLAPWRVIQTRLNLNAKTQSRQVAKRALLGQGTSLRETKLSNGCTVACGMGNLFLRWVEYQGRVDDAFASAASRRRSIDCLSARSVRIAFSTCTAQERSGSRIIAMSCWKRSSARCRTAGLTTRYPSRGGIAPRQSQA